MNAVLTKRYWSMTPFNDRYRAAIYRLLLVSSGVHHLLTSHMNSMMADSTKNNVLTHNICFKYNVAYCIYMSREEREITITLTVWLKAFKEF